jgi:hypothetical protein
MKIRHHFLGVVFLALLLMCLGTIAVAQQPSQQDLRTLSPPVHAALYPEVMCVGCVVPEWDHGYLLHREIDKDPTVVTMY